MPTFTINKKGGYETVEVDAYINSLEQQLKEYENKASAINKAIISAQLASDKMIKQANEETASVLKKANEQSAATLKKANDEAADIVKKANEEKDKIMAEAHKCSAALAENAGKEIQDIKANITQQKILINSFNKDYSALVEKYLKAYNPEVTANVIKNLDDIDTMLNGWIKNGIPDVNTNKSNATTIPNLSYGGLNGQKTIVPNLAITQTTATATATAAAASTPVHTPAPAAATSEPEVKNEEPKTEAIPSPLAASSVPKVEEPKPAQEAPKTFIKTGLAGGAGMGGIPANPSYGLGGERTLKNSVNHSETPKPAEQPAPEPVSTTNINVPKFGEAVEAEKPAQEAPKPGIYKVSADNHLYNENNNGNDSNNGNANNNVANNAGVNNAAVSNTSNANGNAANPTNPANAAPKPGIYKVTADNHLYNDNTDK